ncbi:sialate O-acetylesterase [bacterium]
MKINRTFQMILFFLFIGLSPLIFGEVTLPRLISDGMVLQRDADVKIWGWASAGEEISLQFIDNQYTTSADDQGNWKITLSDLEAGGPYEMHINASNQVSIQDILIGDVWICSGQSNMVLPMKRVNDLYQEEIDHSENPLIRYFRIPDHYDFYQPQKDIKAGAWKAADPDNTPNFAATAYFFAKALVEKYQLPIGLINASVGGSPIEAWMSEDALNKFPAHLETLNKFRDSTYVNQIGQQDKARNDTWYHLLQQRDQGLVDGQMPWFDVEYDASEWPTMSLPCFWDEEGLGSVNGVVWFRKEVNIPGSMVGKSAMLRMGRIVDADFVYLNGQLVGSISYQYPPRKYKLPENSLKPGKNIIVARVINNIGRGGFIKDKPYQLEVDGQMIDLKGSWQYKLGAVMEPLQGKTFINWQPAGLYNGMISPLLKTTLKGIIWYQGESNIGREIEYQKLFPALIEDWRKKWNQGDFSFIYAQLPNYGDVVQTPSESGWAEFREAQLNTLDVTNTAMTVNIDLGEWNDIHPLNKKDVGYRLALAAQKLAYGDEIVHSGPIFESMEIKRNKIIVAFSEIGNGLTIQGEGKLNGFAIAGADKQFIWAKAKIKNNKVIVWNKAISNPIAVRYAWADNPEKANLVNKNGLPASPFRTDE